MPPEQSHNWMYLWIGVTTIAAVLLWNLRDYILKQWEIVDKEIDSCEKKAQKRDFHEEKIS